MTNAEQQQTYAMLARNYLKAAEAARRPSFDDFHRAHQAEWAARQALTGDQTALAEVIVGMAEEVKVLREALSGLVSLNENPPPDEPRRGVLASMAWTQARAALKGASNES